VADPMPGTAPIETKTQIADQTCATLHVYRIQAGPPAVWSCVTPEMIAAPSSGPLRSNTTDLRRQPWWRLRAAGRVRVIDTEQASRRRSGASHRFRCPLPAVGTGSD
jgi:hypothetical protein